MESLENKQAAEKDKVEIVNKNLDGRFNALEDMMKTFMSQVRMRLEESKYHSMIQIQELDLVKQGQFLDGLQKGNQICQMEMTNVSIVEAEGIMFQNVMI